MTQRLKELSDAKSPSQNVGIVNFPNDLRGGNLAETGPHMTTNATLQNWTEHEKRSDATGHDEAEPHDQHSRTDALALIMTSNDDDRKYGESSTIALIRQVAPRVVTEDAIDKEAKISPTPYSDIVRKSQHRPILLPPPDEAKDFLRCFWDNIHPVFPVLHRPTFMVQFETLSNEKQLFNPNGDDAEAQVVFQATLNLVFALGSQFSTQVPEAQKTSMGEEFYQRSSKAFVHDILDASTLGSIQMLLLSAVYLQSTSRASRCWNVVGLAIRAAQGAGIHREYSDRKECQSDREMRRRIWHLCMSLDRLVSMTFGRPSMIHVTTTHIPLPLPINDETLSIQVDTSHLFNDVCNIGCFIHSCSLFDILHEVLSKFYADSHHSIGSLRSSLANTLPDILALNSRLDQFLDNLPEYLRPDETASVEESEIDRNGSVSLQRQVLHARFLYVRVLLLRPLLLSTLSDNTPNIVSLPVSIAADSTTSTLNDGVIRQICELCVSTAQRLLHQLHSNLGNSYRIYGWHSVYFTFAATVILLSYHRSTASKRGIDQESLSRSWLQAMAILERHKPHIRSANRAIELLQALRRHLTGEKRRFDSHAASEDRDESNSSNDGSDTSGMDPRSHPNNQDGIADEESRHDPVCADDPTLEPDWTTWFTTTDSDYPNAIENDWFNDNFINLDFLELSKYQF